LFVFEYAGLGGLWIYATYDILLLKMVDDGDWYRKPSIYEYVCLGKHYTSCHHVG
jgi:hypothetical protein